MKLRAAASPRPPARRILAIAFATATSLGLLDAALGLARGSGSRLGPFLPFLTTVVVASFLGYLVAWWLAVAPLGRRLGLDLPSLAVALGAFFLGTLVGVAMLRWGRHLSSPLEPGLAPLLGLAFGVAAYLCLRGARTRRWPSTGQALVLPLGLAATLGLVWLLVQPGLPGSWGRIVAAAGYLGALGLISWLHLERDRRLASTLAIALLTAISLAGLLQAGGGRPAAPAATGGGPAGGEPARIVLIVVDTLRADHLSTYSSGAPPTPEIDAFADRAVVFERAYAPAPWTLPSMVSMMTGLSPLVHRACDDDSTLPESIPTLAEKLRQAGYRTAAFGENPFLLPRSALDRGFETYDFFPRAVPNPPLGWLLWRLVAPEAVRTSLPAEGLTRVAGDWVARQSGASFFLWLHYYDPHLPYEPPSGYLDGDTPPAGMERQWNDLLAVRHGHLVPTPEQRAWIRRLYAAEVRYVDRAVGRLFDRLEELGAYDDALIVLTSDHGEEFWEHGGLEHGHTVYEEVIRVPLIVKLPGQRRGLRTAARVSTESLMATVLTAGGVEFEEEALSGRSLLGRDLALAGDLAAREVVSTGLKYYDERTGLIAGGWKYIRFRSTGREELYDLGGDPAEEVSLAAFESRQLATLRARLEAVEGRAETLRARHGVGEGEHRGLDAEVRERLRSLGYVD